MKFESGRGGRLDIADSDNDAFDAAIHEVAAWLGYQRTPLLDPGSVYNRACEEHPDEVRKRLREAK